MVIRHSAAMRTPVRVTTDCYSDRITHLRHQLELLQSQCRHGGWSEELEDLLQQQIRIVYAALWALHAEVEQD